MKIPKIFGKKKKKETLDTKDDTKKEGIKKEMYRVVLKEKLGDTTRTIKTLDAKRFIDVDNHVVLLTNDKLKFMEIFPEEMKDFNDYQKKKIDAKLIELKKVMQDELDDDTELNEKDVEFEIMKLEAIKRGFQYEKGSYITFAEDGQPEFTFLREGSSFHPFRWDADTKTIYTPSDNKKKSAILSLRNKETKYGPKNIVETITIILLICGLILTIGNLWGGYKIYQSYDDSKIANLELRGAVTLDYCSNIMLENAKLIQGITQDLSKEYFEKNVTVIDVPDYLINK